MLNSEKYKQYKSKYNKIRTRDKVKFYDTMDPKYEVFAFLPGKFPLEFAPKIDYNSQFKKQVLVPINKVMNIMKYADLTPDLCYSTPLW